MTSTNSLNMSLSKKNIQFENKMKFVSVVLLVILLSVTVFAYGPEGHQIIAEVAYRLLSKQAKNKILRITDGAQLWSLSTIPDDFNHNPGGEWAKPIHFITVTNREGSNMIQDCKANCIVSALQNYTQILMKNKNTDLCIRVKSKENPNPEPCALSNIVHFVGDIHQPLHCSNEKDLPRGGNLIKVTTEFTGPGGQKFTRKDVRLHQVWDSGMLFQYKTNNGYKSWMQVADDVMRAIQAKPSMLQHVNLDYMTWARESLILSISALNYDKKNLIVNQQYYDQNMPIIFERLTDGAVRLAAVLERILS